MKPQITFLLLLCALGLFAQEKPKLSTIEFVEVLNENRDEARYYFENNWKVFRQKALERNYIAGFQLLETAKTKEASFDFILVTTYANENSYANGEKNFQSIISEAEGLKLLNQKKPSEFRKSVAVQEKVMHLE
ncbi:hypothetical protein [Allomuricauda sp. d1]|uniref:hypothetical protein n=1 Tax=Allomuricauda sp. d1 TaxID=3136725 RepID=UPI0031DA1940